MNFPLKFYIILRLSLNLMFRDTSFLTRPLHAVGETWVVTRRHHTAFPPLLGMGATHVGRTRTAPGWVERRSASPSVCLKNCWSMWKRRRLIWRTLNPPRDTVVAILTRKVPKTSSSSQRWFCRSSRSTSKLTKTTLLPTPIDRPTWELRRFARRKWRRVSSGAKMH